VPGTIVSLSVYPGDRVRRGQLLVRLDDREYWAVARAADWNRQGRVSGALTAEREREAAAASWQQSEAEATRSLTGVRVAQREFAGSEAAVSEARASVE